MPSSLSVVFLHSNIVNVRVLACVLRTALKERGKSIRALEPGLLGPSSGMRQPE